MMNSKQSLGRLFSAALCLGLSAAVFAAPRKTPAKPAHVAPMPVTTPKAPSAAPAPGDVVVYNGADAATAGLTLAAWGGGSVQDSADISFAKGHSLKATTLGPYQGARITFNTPLDVGSLDDKARMFQITLRLTKADRTFPPSPTDDNGNGFPDQGGPGDEGGFGGPFGNAGPAPASLSTLKTVHFLFTLANGAQADILRPMPIADSGGAEQWVNLAVPLVALRFSPAADGSPLQSVSIAGDDFAVFYIGQIKLIHDVAPITCYAGDRQDIMPRQPVALHGSADGGASSLQYAWDFDDKDGVTAQAYGPDVTTQYLTSGDYKVTLTVSDIDGLKKPATATTIIHVSQ
ncbi:MAG: PKD domain-containing protein [Armatimonadota bacterium]|nr:PKD domain-containing protein [Armatimonadota bacterium]